MSGKIIRTTLYLRVSTDGQTTENQRIALEAVARQRGWTIVGIVDDNGVSGAKGRDRRPGLDGLLKDAARGKFDVVMCWALDRLGRSVADLIGTLQALEAAHVDLYLDAQQIDTTSPAGRLFYHVTAAFAQFEHQMIVSRVRAGLQRARSRGVRLGRRPVSAKIEAAARKRLAAGAGMLRVAKELGIGSSTVQRINREMKAAQDAR
jgi:DNA invertase Pin-like site-specific DNA recombinase